MDCANLSIDIIQKISESYVLNFSLKIDTNSLCFMLAC